MVIFGNSIFVIYSAPVIISFVYLIFRIAETISYNYSGKFVSFKRTRGRRSIHYKIILLNSRNRKKSYSIPKIGFSKIRPGDKIRKSGFALYVNDQKTDLLMIILKNTAGLLFTRILLISILS